MKSILSFAVCLAVFVALPAIPGCASGGASSGTPDAGDGSVGTESANSNADANANAPVATGARFLLEEDPGDDDSFSVAIARGQDPGTEMVLEGRVKEITRGYYAFTLMDNIMNWCGRKDSEECDTPWDYCCHQADELTP